MDITSACTRPADWARFERDLSIGGRRLHYMDTGQGPECLVLVHGMGGRWQHWMHTIAAFAESMRVVAVDLPGFGRSDPAPSPSMESLAVAVADVLDALQVQQVVAAGHSMGGPIVSRLGALRAQLARASIWVAGATYQFADLLGLRRVWHHARTRPRETAAIATEVATARMPVPRFLRGVIARSAALRRLSLWPYVRDPGALDALSASLILDGAGAAGVFPSARAVGRTDMAAAAAERPILYIAGDRDLIVPLADSELFARRHPRARMRILAGCGHMPMLEQPGTFNAAIADFVSSLAGAG